MLCFPFFVLFFFFLLLCSAKLVEAIPGSPHSPGMPVPGAIPSQLLHQNRLAPMVINDLLLAPYLWKRQAAGLAAAEAYTASR